MSSMLRLGSRGQDVGRLQSMLRRYSPNLDTDCVFGPLTERAVRVSQRHHGLYPPDGIAGPLTMGALSRLVRGTTVGKPTRSVPVPAQRVARAATAQQPAPAPGAGLGDPGPLRHAVEPARARARTATMPSGTVLPVAKMLTSRALRRFIIAHEGQPNVSNRLHHPSMGSGVTIGPGYDMKDRTRVEIATDLKAVGVAAVAAAGAAEGAGLSGSAARRFAQANKQLFVLTPNQESDLLLQIIGHYEAKVKRAVKVPLHQHEYDALVSYAYNPGAGWIKTTRLVNEGRHHEAMVEIKRHVYSRRELVRSLVRRREAESRMFLYGEYR